VRDLVESVNSGQLDLILTKPIPALFFTSFKILDVFLVIRDYLVSIIAIVSIINWSNLNIQPQNLLIGGIILILGYIISEVVHFLSALPVFWFGESSGLIDLFYYIQFDFVTSIPFEGFSKFFQLLFIYAIPLLISSGLATAVILGFIDGVAILPVVVLITIVSLLVKFIAWRVALRNYTSASN
jgi:ABC-type uncharacterized transport system permease subunit